MKRVDQNLAKRIARSTLTQMQDSGKFLSQRNRALLQHSLLPSEHISSIVCPSEYHQRQKYSKG